MFKYVQIPAKFRVIPIGIGLVLIFFSCGKENVDVIDCAGSAPTYTADTKSILDASCAKSGCHDAATHESGYDFSTYAAAMSSSQSEAFLGAIQHKNGCEAMPNDGPKLSLDKIKLLTCWSQNGSPE